ncbi:LysR substrate-binding domain-containing protein [Glycomyces sp. A-F 0318]|uniref:LysR family transcriptional regulator n=1 Tax=Glycomyces amatae TaxID=2881355 RepID=UPI001E64B1A2|nr:LysR substrate-binding domain-containing protein [Glycomyces amatae]MCD0442774.1 LysR substrate-binding domain-containing protein [Glycomyces amatae]
MRPQQLQAFLAVAKNRHFTHAAEELGVTQPSLSKQIQTLEAELGAPLLTRSRGRIELTDAGQTLLPHARRITAAHAAARADIDDVLAVRTGHLRLGATPSLCSWLIAPLLTRYLEAHPGVTVTLTEDGSGPLTERLSAGDLDLAFTIGDKADATGLTVRPLLAEALVVASAAHLPPLTRQAYIGLSQLREQAFVLPAHGYDLRDLTITTCEAAGFTPRTGVDGGATDAVASLVEAGLGIALLPAMIAAGRPGLRATPLAPPGASRTIVLAVRRDAPSTKAAGAFAACLEAHLTDLHAWGRLPEGMRSV